MLDVYCKRRPCDFTPMTCIGDTLQADFKDCCEMDFQEAASSSDSDEKRKDNGKGKCKVKTKTKGRKKKAKKR